MGTLGSILGIHHLLTIEVEADRQALHLGNAIAAYSSSDPGPMDGYFLAIAVLAGWIASVCLHEFGHAIVAYWGGDITVKDKGYLTLNPLKYTDIGYSLALPVVFLMLGGIALPGAAVYINHTLLRSRGWNSAVSAAGPLMTGVVAIALAIPLHFDWVDRDHWFWQALALLAFYQVAGLCFNLCPVPSFDGFGILEPWLPRNLQGMARRWGRYGYLALFAILWTVPAANRGFWLLVRDISHDGLGIPLNLVEQGSAVFSGASKGIFVVLLLGALLFRKVWGGSFNQPSETANLEMNIAAYDRLIEAGKATPEIWKHKGDMLQQLERYEAAIAAFDQALKTQPKDPELWHSRAMCFHNLDRHDEALVAYDRALELQPDNSSIWTNKARALEHLKRPKEAVAAYDRSIKLAPSELDNWFRRGQLLCYELQAPSAALSDYERVLQYQPNHEECRLNHSIALEKLGRTDEALEGYQKVLRYDPNNSYAWKGKWRILDVLKRNEEALQVLEKAQRRFPKDADLWAYRGITLETTGRADDAIESYDKALEYNSKDSDTWRRKILLLERLNRTEEALEVLETAQNRFSQELDLWLDKGRIYFYRQEYDLAIAAFDHCLQLQYSEALAHYNKACCYALQDKPDLAIQALTEVLNCGDRKLLADAENDSDLERLKNLEAFQDLLSKAKSTET